MRHHTLLVLLAALLLVPVPAARAAQPQAPSQPGRGTLDATGRYIVVLDGSAEAAVVRDRHARRNGVKADRLYQHAVRGFAGRLTAAQAKALRADPDVAAVVPDEIVELAAQTIPTGVSRVGARSSSVARIDGVDQRVDADVAVVDTGIDRSHPDLNVAGGVNCSSSDRTAWNDDEGHGTHVAGTVGAIDNGSGVVGVAPGVRLWAVKILDRNGEGYLSWYVCGLDWIAAQRDPRDATRPLFEAVNMSVAKWGTDGGSCGTATNDVLHQAICRVTGAGITVVAAAANDSGSAARRVPAAYNEVITVSALADTDGKAGGTGGNRCYSWGSYDVDDTFANFSNYGYDVDLIAPGKCIWSTMTGNRYGYSSGTSMAAPAVTGAAALYRASRPWSTPTTTKAALQLLGSLNWLTSTDPDSTHERLLDVSKLGPAGDFQVVLGGPLGVGEAGGKVAVPITVERTATHFETVRLVGTTPPGFAASLDVTSLTGFTAEKATLTVTVPAGLAAGQYPVTVTATEGPRKRQATTQIVVSTDTPVARPPTAVPAYGYALKGTLVPVRVSWPTASDPSTAIAGYELQYSLGGGAWGQTASFDSATRFAIRYLAVGQGHRFRVRARDAAGNWSAWAQGSQLVLGAIDSASSAMSYSSGWRRVETTWAWAGTLSATSTDGSRVRTTVANRTVTILAPVGPTRGWFDVYVDGVFHSRISLWASENATRRVVWVRNLAAGPKVIELRALRNATRSLVYLDAIFVAN